MAKIKLPFSLDNPSPVEYVTEAANIEYDENKEYSEGTVGYAIKNAGGGVEYESDYTTIQIIGNTIKIDPSLIDKEDFRLTYKSYEGTQMITSDLISTKIYDPSGNNLAIKIKNGQYSIMTPNGGPNPNRVLDVTENEFVLKYTNNKNFLFVDNNILKISDPHKDNNCILFDHTPGTTYNEQFKLTFNGIDIIHLTNKNSFVLGCAEGKLIEAKDDKVTYFDNNGCPFIEIQDVNINIYYNTAPLITTDDSIYRHLWNDSEVLEWNNYSGSFDLSDCKGNTIISVQGDNEQKTSRLWYTYTGDEAIQINVDTTGEADKRQIKLYGDELLWNDEPLERGNNEPNKLYDDNGNVILETFVTNNIKGIKLTENAQIYYKNLIEENFGEFTITSANDDVILIQQEYYKNKIELTDSIYIGGDGGSSSYIFLYSNDEVNNKKSELSVYPTEIEINGNDRVYISTNLYNSNLEVSDGIFLHTQGDTITISINNTTLKLDETELQKLINILNNPIEILTQEEYDTIEKKDINTIYYITE